LKLKYISSVILGAALLCSCGGNRRLASPPADPYDSLAEKISAGGLRLANRKVAVLPLSYTDHRASNDGLVISERLLTRIMNKGRLELVERSLLEKVMAELKLENSGGMDENSIKGLGKILGVEAVVSGTLTRTRDGRIEVNARLIKTESAAVLAAASELVAPDWEGSGNADARPVHLNAPQPAQRQLPPVTPAAQQTLSPSGPLALSRADRANCPKGMLGYWNFDAVSGDTLYDVFGGNNGRLVGDFRKGSGVVNSGLDFSGQDYVDIQWRDMSKKLQAVTVEAWVNYRSINYSDSGSRIFCANGIEYCFVVGGPSNWNSNLSVYIDGASKGDWVRGNSPVSPNAWHHVAFSYDGGQLTFFMDGRIDKRVDLAGDLTHGNGSTYIGWDPKAVGGYHSPINGLLDELAVYDRALAPEEIAAHYANGLRGGGYCRARG
jgi:TolB-like protein